MQIVTFVCFCRLYLHHADEIRQYILLGDEAAALMVDACSISADSAKGKFLVNVFWKEKLVT